jgi:hypothetical protein
MEKHIVTVLYNRPNAQMAGVVMVLVNGVAIFTADKVVMHRGAVINSTN